MEEYDKVEEISRKHKHNCFCVQEVVSGLRQPVSALHSGDGSGRLFILEREGYVKILTPEGEMLKEPYLDIHKLVQSGIKVFPECSCFWATVKNGLETRRRERWCPRLTF
uniref:Hedgehog interacting protein n=1 Tax=Molossus molossus TaxID=27622 RepID=A0A7J8I6T3_MOLMO|nr:hedgehog interacting protein [Molossus molossus]